ncbi:hypothetical protein F4802DRAFT_592739 [Xylaria palmicola]|nr:hypothetical protein F4802DRAFT_592739 [Xylaria palmicola]
MASRPVLSEAITAVDMMALVKVDWEKLAAKAGFKDGVAAQAYYGGLLSTDGPGDGSGDNKKPGNTAIQAPFKAKAPAMKKYKVPAVELIPEPIPNARGYRTPNAGWESPSDRTWF